DLQDALVVLRAVVVAHLAGHRDLHRADEAGLEGAKRRRVAAVLGVLVALQLDAPARDAAVVALALRDGRDVDHLADAREVRDGELLSELARGERDARRDVAAAHAQLHELGGLAGHAGHELGLRVREEAHVVDLAGLGREALRRLGDGETRAQALLRVRGPLLAERAEAIGRLAVVAHRGDLHRGDLDDGDGDGDFLAARERLGAVVGDDRVRHARLVAREALDLRLVASDRPRGHAGDLAARAHARREAFRTLLRSVGLAHGTFLLERSVSSPIRVALGACCWRITSPKTLIS